MARLWIPPEAEAAIQEAEGRAEAERVREFTQRLKALDPRLDLFLQTKDSGELRAGFYYVRRKNDDGTIATWEVSKRDGSFREPDEEVIEALRKSDSWTRDVWHDEINRGREEARRRIEAEKRRQREEDQEHLKELADFRFRTQFRPGDTRKLKVER